MISRLLPLALLLLTALATGAAAGAQEDPPVGWPYRPERREHPVPKPVMPTPAAPRGSEVPADAFDDGLPPLEQVLLPIAPLNLSFEPGRIALSRDEYNRLKRLAERLRAGAEHVRILSRATALGENDERAALERALARGLLVRELLIGEGISVRRIEMRAEPLPPGSGAGETLVIGRAEP